MANDCASCVFTWAATSECRRFPPTIVLVGSTLRSMWPIVTDDDWCGEFKPASGGGGNGGTGIVLTSLTPNSLGAGTPPLTVTIAGTGFDSTCQVDADGNPRSTFYISPTEVQYTARPDLMTSGQVVQITVVGAAGTSNALPFTYT